MRADGMRWTGQMAIALVMLSTGGILGCEDPPPTQEETSKQVQALINESRAKDVIATATKVLEEAKKHPPLTPIAKPPESKYQVLSLNESHSYERAYVPVENDCELYASHSEILSRAAKPEAPRKSALSVDYYRDRIKDLDRLTHVLVCRSTKVVPPKVVSRTTFTGCTYAGECRLYELSSMAYQGGFEVKAQVDEALAKKNEKDQNWSFGYELGKSIGKSLSDKLFGKATQDDQRIEMICKFSE